MDDEEGFTRKLVIGITRKSTNWVLEQIKPGTSLGAKMTKLKLSCFRHIMRCQDTLEKTVMLGKLEGSRKIERATMRWTDSFKEPLGYVLRS